MDDNSIQQVALAETISGDFARELASNAGKTHGLSPELLLSMMYTESRLKPKAVSKAGARGLMQLMPKTAKELGVKDPHNPEQNVHGGAKYLRQLLDRFGGNLDKALQAYHAGSGNVRRGTIPRPSRAYARTVLNRYNILLGD